VGCGADIVEPCGLDFRQLGKLADEQVMAHLTAGHGDALAILFDRYQRLVFNVALKILRDAAEAEDVMQGVFLEIMRVATQFDPQRGSTKVWLLQYAYHRSMNRRQRLIVRHFYDNTEISDLQEVLAAPSDAGPASIVTKQTVQKALNHLNPVQRRVLYLAYFEGLSLKEIAASTGESFGNVRNHYYRGISKLRSVIAQSERAPGLIVRGETADAGA
jgi:RNA polymerase sigma-70 factor (ECF subfamily)